MMKSLTAIPVAVAASVALLTPLAASSAVAAPAISLHGVSQAVSSEADASFYFKDSVVERGKELHFGIGASGANGDIGQFSAQTWDLPEGVTAESVPSPEPIWPSNDYKFVVSKDAPVGSHTISVTGTVTTGSGDALTATATGTLTIVHPHPSEVEPHGYSIKIPDSPIGLELGASTTLNMFTTSPKGEGTYLFNFKSEAPEGLTVTAEPAKDAPLGTYTLNVHASRDMPEGRYKFAVRASLSDSDIFRTVSAAQELIVKVVAPGSDTNPVRPECTIGDDFESRISEWRPTTRAWSVVDCDRKALSEAKLTVDAHHWFPQELRYSLISPDDEVIVVREAGERSPASGTYTVDLSDYDAEGLWTLQVEDTRLVVTGTLKSWSLTL